MKSLFNFLAVVLLTLAIQVPAHAGLLLDPYLSLETGNVSSGGVSKSANGNGMGVRVAYSTLGFWLGVDYGMSTLKATDFTTGDLGIKDLGLSVGYKFPIFFRVYGAYIFSASMNNNSVDYAGTGTKVGVSFTGLPFLSINLETIARSYTKAKIGSVEGDTDLKISTTCLSVSLPFDI